MEQAGIEYVLSLIDQARTFNAKAADHLDGGRLAEAGADIYHAQLRLAQLQHSMLRYALVDERDARDGLTARP